MNEELKCYDNINCEAKCYSDNIGYFAKSLAGHDKSAVYIVVGEESGYVYLADGKNKTIENPKKKKLKHTQIIKKRDDSIESKQKKQINVINEDIKRAIRIYISNSN